MAHMTNPLATVDQLYRRTSSFSALPSDLQDAIFFATQTLTQAAGLLLRLPQSVTAQANVVLARYWLEEPLLADEFSDVSAASLFLVSKLSGHPSRPRDVTNVYAYLLSPGSPLFRSPPSSSSPSHSSSTTTTPDPSTYYVSESDFDASLRRILRLEARIQRALGFDTHVALPHGLAVTYLQALDFCGSGNSDGSDGSRRARVTRRVVAHLNTALLSPQMLYLTHQPNALAVAAIYSAARDAGVGAKMPECPWWEVFDVDREELGFLVVGMRSLGGLVRKLRGDFKALAEGRMITRRDVEVEMARRGLKVRNGAGAGAGVDGLDEEEAMMRSLDARAEKIEA
ncbi:cyclin [Xylaria sp. FL1777]|nr:cyclin [Xylaria sp. FL1777]